MISVKTSLFLLATFIAGAFVASPVPQAIAAIIATDVQCTGCVGTADMAGNAVTSLKIKDGEVKSADLASNVVTSAKIASNTVQSSDIRDGTIEAVDIAPAVFMGNDVKVQRGNIVMPAAGLNEFKILGNVQPDLTNQGENTVFSGHITIYNYGQQPYSLICYLGDDDGGVIIAGGTLVEVTGLNTTTQEFNCQSLVLFRSSTQNTFAALYAVQYVRATDASEVEP